MNHKKWILAGLSIIIIVFIIFFGYKALYGKNYIIAINGEKVASGEFKFILDGVKDTIKSRYGLTDFNTVIDGQKASDLAKERASESVVSYTLENQKAKERGISLNEQELSYINSRIKTISTDQSSLDSIKNAGLSMDDFKKLYIKFNTASKLKQKILSEIKKNITTTDQEAINYYNSKKEEKYTYTQDIAKVRHILFKTIDANQNPLSGDAQYRAKSKAEEILKRAKAGEDFASLAKQYSEDTGTKEDGGEFTFSRRDSVAAEFKEASFVMNSGEISGLVKTQFGYHIIKLEEKHLKGQAMNFESIKDSVKVDAQYDKMMEEWKKGSKIIKNDVLYNLL